ncbi:lipocalin-like domain-containing protein [Deinococcus peraridilitoris]|uniref:Lipocalin-like domain-containing protein n=1 Tax=Deinococcus peraridilitoris (strain DSM 19664 / LMG 22246 / CIP 109416 / KR-200) TaxID=937777 RepID=L0A472_DEIPD|nr:lipocalin-like domain-containing protein [Deinococcus peraridilitoris]AFZ68678.1 hypothetical protein Deipe_3235 [Deinococcus peraridilitoris DSM 19664]
MTHAGHPQGEHLGLLLPGTWLLDCLELVDDLGQVTLPWGPDVRGRIAYLPGGFLSVVMTAGQRTLSVPVHLVASDAELAPLARTCIAYSGRWTAFADRVEHYPDVSLNPNYLAGAEVRFAVIQGEQLTLSAPPFPYQGRHYTRRILWRRESCF